MDPPMLLPYLPTLNTSLIYPVDISQNHGALSYNYNNIAATNNSANYGSSFGYTQVAQPAIQQYQLSLGQSVSLSVNLAISLVSTSYLNPSQNVAPYPLAYGQEFATPISTIQAFQPPANTNLSSSTFLEKLSGYLPFPPLARAPNRPQINYHIQQKRTKRKSKFTREQDAMIIELKKSGKNWVEIAEITKVGSYLAARNRYQVIIGQQGNNNSLSWNQEYNSILKKLIDKYEIEKWVFITKELNKIFNKNYDYKEVQALVQNMFVSNPYSFKVTDELLMELDKEKRMTDKAMESAKNNDFDDFLNYQMDNEYS